jgi:hypothetical protein
MRLRQMRRSARVGQRVNRMDGSITVAGSLRRCLSWRYYALAHNLVFFASWLRRLNLMAVAVQVCACPAHLQKQ